MNFEEDLAYQDGYEAGQSGYRQGDNPYNQETEFVLYNSWVAGFQDAENDEEEIADDYDIG